MSCIAPSAAAPCMHTSCGVKLSFRSLPPGDFEALSARLAGGGQIWAWFSVWIMDGEGGKGKREGWPGSRDGGGGGPSLLPPAPCPLAPCPLSAIASCQGRQWGEEEGKAGPLGWRAGAGRGRRTMEGKTLRLARFSAPLPRLLRLRKASPNRQTNAPGGVLR